MMYVVIIGLILYMLLNSKEEQIVVVKSVNKPVKSGFNKKNLSRSLPGSKIKSRVHIHLRPKTNEPIHDLSQHDTPELTELAQQRVVDSIDDASFLLNHLLSLDVTQRSRLKELIAKRIYYNQQTRIDNSLQDELFREEYELLEDQVDEYDYYMDNYAVAQEVESIHKRLLKEDGFSVAQFELVLDTKASLLDFYPIDSDIQLMDPVHNSQFPKERIKRYIEDELVRQKLLIEELADDLSSTQLNEIRRYQIEKNKFIRTYLNE